MLVAGFQGVTADEEITTLGRGGSDTTAVALAAALEADECEIYTDVDGVFTADPRIVPGARKLDEVSYEEMLEMAATGAEVLQSRSVEYAQKLQRPPAREVAVSRTSEGTWVRERGMNHGKSDRKRRHHDFGESRRSPCCGVPDRPGVAASLFGALAEKPTSTST